MEAWQTTIQLNTLYEVQATGTGDGNQLSPFLEVVGGTVNVYGSVAHPHNPPDNMYNTTPNGFVGIQDFTVIPNYLFITQKTSTTSSIILSGVEATAVAT